MRCIISLVLLAVSLSVFAKLIPVEDFAKPSQYYDVVISPTGEYMAVEMLAVNGNIMVAILKTSDMSVISQIAPSRKEMPFNPIWVNDERVVVQIAEKFGSLVEPFSNGELYAVNADGKEKEMLIARMKFVTNGAVTGSNGNDLFGSADIINLLPNDDQHVLISFYAYSGFSRRLTQPKVYRLNVYTGKILRVTLAPSKGAYFITDPDGALSYSVGIDVENDNDYLVHKYEEGKWVFKNRFKAGDKNIIPIAAIKGSNEVIFSEENLNETEKLYKLNLETEEKTLLFQNKDVDPTFAQYDTATDELVVVGFDAPYPDVAIINPEHPYGHWYPAIRKVFTGKDVMITSATRDYSLLTVQVSADNEARQFYIFNTKTKKLALLLNSKSWMKKEELANTQAFQLKARDGLVLNGYLTLPKDQSKNLPMVVVPHGGPHGPRTYWGYDEDVQFLASRGYAVLEINFRGSGGYGLGFERSGYKKWGAEIQYDIIDATKWAIKEGFADSKRVCIFGGSFGGYSALMSATLEPDLYKCAIGYAGIYDLNLMWKKGDIQSWGLGLNYLEDAIGKDKAQLDQYSPIKHIDKLKAPVLLIHGKKDERAHVEHYYHMVKALKKAKHPHETMLVKKEGHGFYEEKNRKEMYERIEAFLGKYIGK